MATGGALMVAGTSSDAGKSVITAGLCRWLARQGVRVAPYKAQNMSLNSMVTADGAEISRAQEMQARAAMTTPTAAMNPLLLKPGSDRRSHLVVLGKPAGEVEALGYGSRFDELRAVTQDSLAELRAEYDAVICEGAGSPAEINLRDRDLVNMGLARGADMPVIVVADIDRGGIFASLYGTVALLSPEDQALISGFVVNKFRGDERLLAPGIDRLTELTGRPTFGVLPWRVGLWLDMEDSLPIGSARADAGGPVGSQGLRVAVVRLPRISNFTDVDALAAEPGVSVRFVAGPGELADADLVILPGSRATMSDLAWLAERGLDREIERLAGTGVPVLGICGGAQMLGASITDPAGVESTVGHTAGLGLLPINTEFLPEKTLRRSTGTALGEQVHGYEIHHGVLAVDGGEPFLDGARVRNVFGSTWHGTLENDGFRRVFLIEVARLAGRDFVPAPDTDFARLREDHLDSLGDLVGGHLDTDAVLRLLEHGAPTDLPIIRT